MSSSSSSTDKFQLKWPFHLPNLNTMVATLYSNEKFADVLLIASNHENGPATPVPAHKFVLSSCSQFFATLFESNPAPLNAIMYVVLPPELSNRTIQTLIQYMYSGEATVSNAILPEVLRGGEVLKIRGLCRDSTSNDRPQFQTAPIIQMNPSTTPSPNSMSIKPPTGVDPLMAYQTKSSDIPRSTSAATINRIVTCLKSDPSPPSAVNESAVIVMSPRHVSHPQAQHMLNQHREQNGGGTGAMNQTIGGQAIKREICTIYPVTQPTPHGTFNVRKGNMCDGVVTSAEIHEHPINITSRPVEYIPENSREMRYRDDRRSIDRLPSIDHQHNQPHHQHQHAVQPSVSQPQRLVIRDTEVLRMSNNCSTDILHQRVQQLDTQLHHHHQSQSQVDHNYIESDNRLSSSQDISMGTTINTDRMATITANNNTNNSVHRINISSACKIPLDQTPIDHHHIDIEAGNNRLSSSHGISMGTTNIAGRMQNQTTNIMAHRIKVSPEGKITLDGPMQKMPVILNDSQKFQPIKQEPQEWSEITVGNNGAAQRGQRLDHKLDVSIKPELDLPGNEDSCSATGDEEMVYSPLTCELCSETFTVPGDWVRHIEGHAEAALYIPKKRKRMESDNATVIAGASHDNIAALRCDLCAMLFGTPAEWVRHVQDTHTEMELAHSNSKRPIRTGSRPIRPIAPTVNHAQDLVIVAVPQHQQHQTHSMSAHHSQTSTLEKSCSICKQTFASYAHMLAHKRTHTG